MVEAPSGALSWSRRVDPPLSGATNMARDHALALGVEPGSAVLRLYRWRRPTLSLGRNEPARGRVDAAAAAELGVDLVRRPTGGRAVLHNRELTYAVCAPLQAFPGLRAAYARINRALRGGLRSLGVAAAIAPEPAGRVPSPDAGPCFGTAASGELVWGGRKLAGSAQARIGGALLQHGSILIEDDQTLIDRIVSAPPPGAHRGSEPAVQAPRPPATLAESTGGAPPGWQELAEAVARGFEEEMGGSWYGAPPGPVAGEDELRERYRSEAWTWRR